MQTAETQATETFRRLLALTPEPPTGLSASVLISTGEEMLALRETELSILKLLLEVNPNLLKGNTECQKIRDTLSIRDTRWNDALCWARTELSKQRLAAQRARQSQRCYQPPRP